MGAYVQAHVPPTADGVMDAFNEMYTKYRLFEAGLGRQQNAMRSKLAELQSTLDAARLLAARHAAGTATTLRYELADLIYAQASVPPTDRVSLWLGVRGARAPTAAAGAA